MEVWPLSRSGPAQFRRSGALEELTCARILNSLRRGETHSRPSGLLQMHPDIFRNRGPASVPVFNRNQLKSAPPEVHSSHVARRRGVGHLCHLGPSGQHWSECQHSSCPAHMWRLHCPRRLSGHLLNISAWEAGQVTGRRLRLMVAGACPGRLPPSSGFQLLPTPWTHLPVPLPQHSSHLDTEKLHRSHAQSCAVSLLTPTVHWFPLHG